MAGELVSCLIVAPHPDDETLGAGIWMYRHRNSRIRVLHITDGSPRDLSFARRAGFESRRAYAVARRQELRAALSMVNIGRGQMRTFSRVDGESHLHMRELVTRLVAMLEDFKPALVLSPAYEGGHPDHDTAALLVAIARRRVPRAFRHLEYRLYHAGPNGSMATEDFLPGPAAQVEVQCLTPSEQRMKRLMLACFPSQQIILKEFAVRDERFRAAPRYDFTRPPHRGALLYEQWNLGVSGVEWRRYASAVAGSR